MKPSRRIRKSATTSIARFWSEKIGQTVEAESPLERDLLRTLEFDPNVIDYVQQPARIEYVGCDGKVHKYTPDARARFRFRPKAAGPNGILVEVKTERWLRKNWRTMRHAWRAAIKWARANGIAFHIYDERKIRTPYCEAAAFLLRYRGEPSNCAEARFMLDRLIPGDASVRTLLAAAAARGLTAEAAGPALYGLIARFEAVIDLDGAPRLDTIVSLPVRCST